MEPSSSKPPVAARTGFTGNLKRPALAGNFSGIQNGFSFPVAGLRQFSKRIQGFRPTIGNVFFAFVYFRSSTRRRFLLQFDLIVINSGTDEIF